MYTSTSLLFETSTNCSLCSKVLSSLSSVIQNNLIRASFISVRFANTTNLYYKHSVFILNVLQQNHFHYLAIKGTCIASRYNSVAIFEASATFRQSISQNLADTVVVNETQSLTKVRGVEPVTSSHCALDVPPIIKCIHNKHFSKL